MLDKEFTDNQETLSVENLNMDELKKYVPEVEENDEEVVRLIYEKVISVYSDIKDKILAYYYVGYILTADDDSLGGSEVQISNVLIKGSENAETVNPYYLKLKRLLQLKNMNKHTLNKKAVIVNI